MHSGCEGTAAWDRFGFLPCSYPIEFEGGRILPLPNYNQIRISVAEKTHADGFLYPPIEREGAEPGERPLKTERPALIHQITGSHEINLSFRGSLEELRRGPGGFVIHLLAYLFGVRLQFDGRWFDGRVPIRPTHNIHVTKAVVEDFLSRCYQTWNKWDERKQRLITNVLYMHSRAPAYEWDWERFLIEYMVFDGCWKLSGLGTNNRVDHSKRITNLCHEFSIPLDVHIVKRIVGLRNDLFHETLWDKSQPCTGVGEEAFHQAYNLRRLNQRVIPALLGYKNVYVQSNWWTLGTCLFDKP